MDIKCKPKLLIIIGSLELGGAEKHLHTILPRLIDEYDVTIYTTSFAGNFYQEFAKISIPVVYKDLSGSKSSNKISQVLRLARNFWRAVRFIKRHDPEIIHFFLPGSYLLGGYASVLLRRKNLIMSRRSQNDYQKKHHQLATIMEYRLHKKMDVVLANSKKVASQLKQEGVTDQQLQLIYNGVDLNRYSEITNNTLRDELNIDSDTLVFMIVANLFFYKGHADLFKAFELIKKQLPEKWQLLCVGRDAGELATLQYLAKELGLADHITFLGQRMDTAQLMSVSDVGILVSHEEGFSNAILEFMASSKPMMVTDVGGNAEAIIDNECGFVVPAKDSVAMSQALQKLANNPALRMQFGIAARQRAEQHFSLQGCVNAYKNLYKNTLKKSDETACHQPPKIVIVINNLGFLYSHRLPIVLAAAKEGYEVHVATCFEPDAQLRHQDKITYHYIHFNRNSINPITELKPIIQLIKLYRKLKPDLIHHMCKKSSLYGCMITRFMKKTPVVNTVPGLGYLFISRSLKSRWITIILRKGYKFGLNRARLKTIFQNDDDRQLFEKHKMVRSDQCVMIRGSGVDVDEFVPTTHHHDPLLIIIPARLLWDKGVGEFVAAARNLKNAAVRFALVGDVDPINPASIAEDTVRAWVEEGIVEHWGWCDDMVAVLKQADIVCLPSYREGMPKALLEAAAAGLPIVTTDAPGCKDVVVNGESGFIVPVKDTQQLTESLRQLIESQSLRANMGAKARLRVEQRFSTKIIVAEHLACYQLLLKQPMNDLGQIKRY